MIRVSSNWVLIVDNATNFECSVELCNLAERRKFVCVPLYRMDLLVELYDMACLQLQYPYMVPEALRNCAPRLVDKIPKLKLH